MRDEILNNIGREKQMLIRQIEDCKDENAKMVYESRIADLDKDRAERIKELTAGYVEPAPIKVKDYKEKRSDFVDETIQFINLLTSDKKMKKQVALKVYYHFKEENKD